MFIDRPEKPNGLYVFVDARHKFDHDLQEVQGGQPVLREWSFAKAAIGKKAWAGVTRVALYDHGEDTQAAPAGLKPKARKKHIAEARAAKRAAVLSLIEQERPKLSIVLQTRGAEVKSKDDFGDALGLKGTMVWTALQAPDSLAEMAGCVWDSEYGPVMPLLNPVNYEYVYGELIRRHLKGALGFAAGAIDVLRPLPGSIESEPGDNRTGALAALMRQARAGKSIALDIEAHSESQLVTAIGVSNGLQSVSVGWEGYKPRGGAQESPVSYRERTLMEELLQAPCPKILHNYSFDIPFLESKGLHVAGPIHDTMLMHGVVYKQWRHGLQRACASELLIPPWKSLWHPKDPPDGLTRDDSDWWTLDPVALRLYNAKDSYYTWHLARSLAPKAGVKF